MQINTAEVAEIDTLLSRAYMRGQDIGEALDRTGILVTQARHNEIQARAIEEIAYLMSSTSAHQWTQGRGNTQMDLMLALADRLQIMANNRRNGHVR